MFTHLCVRRMVYKWRILQKDGIELLPSHDGIVGVAYHMFMFDFIATQFRLY